MKLKNSRTGAFGGMLMYNHFDQIPGAVMALSAMLAQGSLKSAETVVDGGFGSWAECVDKVNASQTFGRMILALKD